MKAIVLRSALFLTMCLVLLCVTGCQNQVADPDALPDQGITEWTIAFDGDDFTATQGAGVSREGNVILLTRPGIYTLSGTLSDAQICVRVTKAEWVTLVLNELTVSCSTSAPLYIESADKVTVELMDGTVNTLTDAKKYVFNGVETKPNACLYSSEDITFKGEGKLIVNANYNNGIGSKNDVKIKGGSFEINAVKNAIKGNDSVQISGGNILITKCKDGIKTDATEPGRGVLTVTGGSIEIHAEDDGLQASQEIAVSGGAITVEALGKTVNCDGMVNISDGCLTEK